MRGEVRGYAAPGPGSVGGAWQDVNEVGVNVHVKKVNHNFLDFGVSE